MPYSLAFITLPTQKSEAPIILGTELHIEYVRTKKPYHCHIYFNIEEITNEIIDDINIVLDKLYPNKVVEKGMANIPHIEDIIREFDKYDFLLLPHGGQSHSTFDTSIPKESRFDTAMERSIYYNQFDGFTARSNEGLERTLEYFRKLGIRDFVNLLTCTDNYDPHHYPDSKNKEAEPFVPTWMLALPTFNGLRLSLSESSRLVYGRKPRSWIEHIGKVKLKNELIDIDIELTPGLNVVIGGSSSGKTLLVDSIFRKTSLDFTGSAYEQFGVASILVNNPSRIAPHYINQNYIIELIKERSEKGIEDIDIIRSLFPGEKDLAESVRKKLASFKEDLVSFVHSVKAVESIERELSHIPELSRLIINKEISENYLKWLIPSQEQVELMDYPDPLYDTHLEYLDEIDVFLDSAVFTSNDKGAIKSIRKRLQEAYSISKFEKKIRDIIARNKDSFDSLVSSEDQQIHSKKKNFELLTRLIAQYLRNYSIFKEKLASLSRYNITCKTQEIVVMGHRLYIENNIQVTKETLLEIMNKFLRTESKIEEDLNDIEPYALFEYNYKKQTPKVRDYDDFALRVYREFESSNKSRYRILTKDGKNFDDLSAGWKTSILLDLMLGYEEDNAPLIIDQPEDNLATDYINHGLIDAIKRTKMRRQIILVSHNATIPMLGDAQNVIVCKSNGKIIIRSNMLEGFLDKKSIVDYVAEITDGGKPSIKKRVKKYNLKQFREE
jgi:predicted ATP-dependent endonuclease of OLD family